jgi:hypothetical protein
MPVINLKRYLMNGEDTMNFMAVIVAFICLVIGYVIGYHDSNKYLKKQAIKCGVGYYEHTSDSPDSVFKFKVLKENQ